jgi:hypothetical protein
MTDAMSGAHVNHANGLDLTVAAASGPTASQTLSSLVTTSTAKHVDYGLLVDGGEATLAIPRGAVALGGAGARIGNTGAIEGLEGGVGAHIASSGDVTLAGSSIGSAAAAILAHGASEAALRLVADGNVNVNLSAANAFGLVDLTQQKAEASADILHTDSADLVNIAFADGASRLLELDTRESQFDFAYRVDTPEPDAGEEPVPEVPVAIEKVLLGGDLLVESEGDLRLEAPDGSVAIDAMGNGVSLVADANHDGAGAIEDVGSGSAAIDMGDAAGEGAGLRLDAGGDVGTQSAPIRTRGIGRVAGTAAGGGFYLSNEESGDIRVSQVTGLDAVERVGIEAIGDVELWNDATDGRILLDTLAAGGVHVSSGRDQIYGAPVELENARFDVHTQRPPPGKRGGRTRRAISILTASNEAKLVAGRDVFFHERVDTSNDAIATFTKSDGSGGPDVEQLVPGALTIDAQGATSFQADVGSKRPLARLDVTDVRLPAGSTTFTLAGVPVGAAPARVVIDPEAFAVRGAFGRIDGANQLRVTAIGSDDSLSRVSFHGDIGAGEPLASLDVDADRIEFTTAERVLTGTGGIRLNVPGDDDNTPVATIYDTDGSLAFETAGNFETGRLQKLTALGALSIRAQGTASFSDLTALEIAVDALTIVLKGRDPSALLLADGTTNTDAGSDLVANDIALSRVPVWDGVGAKPVLVLGSGGVSAPGNLADFDVIRLNEAIDAVTPAILTDPDGVVLDLTGTGPPLVGDPTRETPREAPNSVPVPEPRIDSAAPAARPQVSGQQLLAFVHCAAAAGAASAACQSALPGVAPPPGSALATQRALDVAARYRTLVASSDARARLRAAFKLAVSAYRERTGGAGVDGARFYSFLRESPAHGETLEQLNELARLFAEIEMLGLSEADTHSVQRALAEEFVEAAGEPGLGADAVIDAVRASAIGLPV